MNAIAQHGLTAHALKTLRRQLEAERHRLQADVRWSAGTALSLGEAQAEEGAATGSPGDVAADLTGQELALALERAERRHLTRVERALRRLAAGRYGACEACGRPIGLARLRVLPWTALCRACVDVPPDLRARGTRGHHVTQR
jgi:RNA polymerase-binding protein DksA